MGWWVESVGGGERGIGWPWVRVTGSGVLLGYGGEEVVGGTGNRR